MKELFNKLSNFSQFLRENRLVNAKGRPETPDKSGPDDSHIDPLAPSGPDMSGPKLEKEHTLEEKSVLAEKTKKKKGKKSLEKYGKRVAKLKREKELFPWEDEEALERKRKARQKRRKAERIKASKEAKISVGRITVTPEEAPLPLKAEYLKTEKLKPLKGREVSRKIMRKYRWIN